MYEKLNRARIPLIYCCDHKFKWISYLLTFDICSPAKGKKVEIGKKKKKKHDFYYTFDVHIVDT